MSKQDIWLSITKMLRHLSKLEMIKFTVAEFEVTEQGHVYINRPPQSDNELNFMDHE